MGTYSPENNALGGVNFFAGSGFPQMRGHKEASAGIRKYEPVVIADGKIKPVSATSSDGGVTYTTGTDGLYGIALEDIASGAEGAVLLSGEVLSSALVVAENVDVAALELPFRNIGIFLK